MGGRKKKNKQTDFQLVMDTYSSFYPIEMNTDSTQPPEQRPHPTQPANQKGKRERIANKSSELALRKLSSNGNNSHRIHLSKAGR
jgi:hypothetical protein